MRLQLPIFLLSIAAILLVSGCVSADPASFAKLNPMVQEFLEEHPEAEIRVTHYSAEEAQSVLDEIMEDCLKQGMTAKEYYKVTIEDPDGGLSVTAWIDWESQMIECAIKRGGEPGPDDDECRPYYKVRCFDGDAYWYDSCGNRGARKEACGNGCDAGRCIGHDLCKASGGYCSYNAIVSEAVIRDEIAEIIASTQTETSLTGMVYAVSDIESDVAMPVPTAGGGGYGGSTGSSSDSCSRYHTCPDGRLVRVCETVKEIQPITCRESNVEGAGKICSSGSTTVGCICKEDPELLCKTEDTICRPGYQKTRLWCPDNGICCIPQQQECRPEAVSKCYSGHVYWYDSCGNKLGKREYCPYGCEGGACKPPPLDEKCYETDGGFNIYEKGVCEAGDQRYEDHCSGSNMLTEKFCADDGITIKWETVECPENHFCEDGACIESNVPENICFDSDGGRDYYTLGSPDLGCEAGCAGIADHCINSSVLFEYSCNDDGTYATEFYTCPHGCEEGACVLEDDNIPPQITMITPLLNSTITQSSVTMSISTDEDATCEYMYMYGGAHFGAGTNWNSMDSQDGFSHQVTQSFGDGIEYTFTFNCSDKSGNSNQIMSHHDVNLAKAPVVTINHPVNNTNVTFTPIAFSVETHEKSNCEYSLTGCTIPACNDTGPCGSGCGGTGWQQMDETGNFAHYHLYNITNQTTYSLYIRCTDLFGYVNDTQSINFICSL